MGCMYDAICPCGYESHDLLEGGGMSGPESERRLARCDRCREIVSVRCSIPTQSCPKCRGALESVAVPSATLFDPAQPETTICPRCRDITLTLFAVGEWE